MIRQTTNLKFTMQSQDCHLSLSTGDVIITDSETGDSVTVAGLTRKRIECELRFYVRCLKWSHDETKRQHAVDWLSELIRDAEGSIGSIREKIEEKAK